MRAFVLLTVAVIAYGAKIEEEWKQFILKYNKTYKSSEDERHRFNIFTKTYHSVDIHNKLHARGLKSYTKVINKFADLLPSELPTGLDMNLYAESINRKSTKLFVPSNTNFSDDIDWRNYGAVTAVKDQGRCGSCWAFATTGVTESQWYKSTGHLPSLSEQFLVDCSHENYGCQGGYMTLSYEFVLQSGGLPSEDDYPYHALDGQCRANGSFNTAAMIKSYVEVPSKNEEALEAAVATVGPIATVFNVQEDFYMYSSGIFVDPTCESDNFNHAVLIVGYGIDEMGNDYWVVKNSWGTDWGEDGYFRVARNKNSHCAIATAPSYVVV